MDPLESHREAGELEFEQVVVARRVDPGAVEFLEEADASGQLAEEPAQHAVLRPDMPFVRRDVLHHVVGRGADDVFGNPRLVGRGAGGAGLLLEILDGRRDLLH